MKIEKITKVGYYYKLKLSDDRIIKFHESIIIKYKWFRRNIEIDELVLETAIKDNDFYLALDKAISYLKRPRSKKEVLLHLNEFLRVLFA
jgi:ribosome-associated translation inhibitor RaiA